MIHHVAGADDPRLAAYAHVGDPARLQAAGLFVAEGRLVVERLIEAGRYEVASVLVSPAAFDALAIRLARLPADVYVAPQSVLNATTGFNFHRGCLALARRPAAPPLARFFDARRLLIVEGVGNPDNIGGLFRAAAALDADGIVLDPRSGDPLYRKAIRTSMGAALRLPFGRISAWPGELAAFRDRGFRLIALTPDSPARTVAAAAADGLCDARLALMLGAEGSGLSREALAAADERVRIPIAPDVDSLNVVVAAAIALYALAPGQSRARGLPGRATDAGC